MRHDLGMTVFVALILSAGVACGGAQTRADAQPCGTPYAAEPLDLGETPPSEPMHPADTPRSECPADTPHPEG